jgi:hypothetical protein
LGCCTAAGGDVRSGAAVLNAAMALSKRLRCPIGTPSFFEVGVGQLGQDLIVDRVLAE